MRSATSTPNEWSSFTVKSCHTHNRTCLDQPPCIDSRGEGHHWRSAHLGGRSNMRERVRLRVVAVEHPISHISWQREGGCVSGCGLGLCECVRGDVSTLRHVSSDLPLWYILVALICRDARVNEDSWWMEWVGLLSKRVTQYRVSCGFRVTSVTTPAFHSP